MNTYCVVLHSKISNVPMPYPRTRRFYLREESAERAIDVAMAENPQCELLGIEPSAVFSGTLLDSTQQAA